MSFDSLAFALFFIPFLTIYWFLPKKFRLIFTLIGSYFFYTSINLAFIPLILFSTVIDYFTGNGINKYPKHKKLLLLTSLTLNLGVLFTFKYYNFFIENIQLLMSSIGIKMQLHSINIIFPVGISFYTIQTIGYTIDVYKGKIKAERNFLNFALFVCFFPQLIAGPLERAKNLLPQLKKPIKPSYYQSQKYLLYILIGLIKKTVVSDRFYEVIKYNIDPKLDYFSPAKNFLTFYLMSFRLYYDFSAYSIMAIGIAGLLGIRLSDNFRFPLFSINVDQFWKRWHITLHDWLRDYIFIPLTYRKPKIKIAAVFLVFFVSGLWHGASWNFLFWGGVNALYLIIYHKFFHSKIKESHWKNSKLFMIASTIFTYHLVIIAAPFYFLTDIRRSIHFIFYAFNFYNFRLIEYLTSLPLNIFQNLIYSVIPFIFIKITSMYFYYNNLDLDHFKEKSSLLNAGIIILFLLFFIFSTETGPLFRYYYF